MEQRLTIRVVNAFPGFRVDPGHLLANQCGSDESISGLGVRNLLNEKSMKLSHESLRQDRQIRVLS